MNFVTEPSELQSAVTVNCLLIPGEKLNIVFMCIVPLVVSKLKYPEHKKLCEFQCLKMYRFFQYASLLNIYILLYCHLRPDILYFKVPWI
jgi:hypothetical protein